VRRGRWSGGQPKSNAREVRSLLVDQLVDVEQMQGGQHDNNNEEDCRGGGATRSSGGDPHDQPPPENHVQRVSNNARTPEGFWIR
jgi:hypothetical protein